MAIPLVLKVDRVYFRIGRIFFVAPPFSQVPRPESRPKVESVFFCTFTSSTYCTYVRRDPTKVQSRIPLSPFLVVSNAKNRRQESVSIHILQNTVIMYTLYVVPRPQSAPLGCINVSQTQIHPFIAFFVHNRYDTLRREVS